MTNKENRGTACDIEIVERRTYEQIQNLTELGIIKPNEIRINGHPVLTPADKPVVIHEIAIDDTTHDGIYVTLSLYARRIAVKFERTD